MNYLFTQESLQVLESLSFTRTLYAFDFDGTLSPIVPDPAKARISPRIAELLRRLSEVAPVAVISGRSLTDLSERLSFKPAYLVGNHGLEGLPGAHAIEKLRPLCLEWRTAMEKALAASPDPGIILEDKEYTLAIHYRQSRTKKAARKLILETIARLPDPPRVIIGKLVFNLVPPGGPHKGAALLRILKHAKAKAAFFAGDDHTDEDVFQLKEAPLFSVSVGRRTPSAARFYVRDQKQIEMLLKRILAFHGISDP